MAPSLSILAPTHNRPDVLAKVWPTWLMQEGLSEIVVVDDGSTNDYTAVFSQLADACARHGILLKIVRLHRRKGAPAAKNAGLGQCTSDEILTTDDDVLLTCNLVAQCRKERPSNMPHVICGPRVIYLELGESQEDARLRADRETAAYFNYRKLTVTPWANPKRVTRYPFITAIALWPRSLFDSGLRYFENYGGNGFREETDPQIRAQVDFNAQVYLIPSAECFHLPASVAYANRGGQRRGGHLWFEFWVLVNNGKFIARYQTELRSRFEIRPWSTWVLLALSRFSPHRVARFANKLRGS